jgi:hypothetical protein
MKGNFHQRFQRCAVERLSHKLSPDILFTPRFMAVTGNTRYRKGKWHRARGEPLSPRLFPEVSSTKMNLSFSCDNKKNREARPAPPGLHSRGEQRSSTVPNNNFQNLDTISRLAEGI